METNVPVFVALATAILIFGVACMYFKRKEEEKREETDLPEPITPPPPILEEKPLPTTDVDWEGLFGTRDTEGLRLLKKMTLSIGGFTEKLVSLDNTWSKDEFIQEHDSTVLSEFLACLIVLGEQYQVLSVWKDVPEIVSILGPHAGPFTIVRKGTDQKGNDVVSYTLVARGAPSLFLFRFVDTTNNHDQEFGFKTLMLPECDVTEIKTLYQYDHESRRSIEVSMPQIDMLDLPYSPEVDYQDTDNVPLAIMTSRKETYTIAAERGSALFEQFFRCNELDPDGYNYVVVPGHIKPDDMFVPHQLSSGVLYATTQDLQEAIHALNADNYRAIKAAQLNGDKYVAVQHRKTKEKFFVERLVPFYNHGLSYGSEGIEDTAAWLTTGDFIPLSELIALEK